MNKSTTVTLSLPIVIPELETLAILQEQLKETQARVIDWVGEYDTKIEALVARLDALDTLHQTAHATNGVPPADSGQTLAILQEQLGEIQARVIDWDDSVEKTDETASDLEDLTSRVEDLEHAKEQVDTESLQETVSEIGDDVHTLRADLDDLEAQIDNPMSILRQSLHDSIVQHLLTGVQPVQQLMKVLQQLFHPPLA